MWMMWTCKAHGKYVDIEINVGVIIVILLEEKFSLIAQYIHPLSWLAVDWLGSEERLTCCLDLVFDSLYEVGIGEYHLFSQVQM